MLQLSLRVPTSPHQSEVPEPFATLARTEDGGGEALEVMENLDSIGNGARVELRDGRGRTADSDDALTLEQRDFADGQSNETSLRCYVAPLRILSASVIMDYFAG